MKCDGARLGMSRVWIVDPVDGTREYGEGRTDWAVHVGLAIDGVAAVGAVALPGLGQDASRSARIAPLRERRSGCAWSSAARGRRRRRSRSRSALGAELVPMGSAGAKAMAIMRGEADIYLHSGGQYEWDSCAPVAVAIAHGLHCSQDRRTSAASTIARTSICPTCSSRVPNMPDPYFRSSTRSADGSRIADRLRDHFC